MMAPRPSTAGTESGMGRPEPMLGAPRQHQFELRVHLRPVIPELADRWHYRRPRKSSLDRRVSPLARVPKVSHVRGTMVPANGPADSEAWPRLDVGGGVETSQSLLLWG